MLLRLIVTHLLRQVAQEKVMEALQRVPAHETAGTDHDLPEEAAPPCDIGIVFATGVEAGGLIDQLADIRRTSSPSLVEHAGSLRSQHLVVVEGGVGGDAATAATEGLIQTHSPRWIISAGFASALSPDLRQADVVMANRLRDVHGDQLDVGLQISEEAIAATPGMHGGELLTVDSVVRRPADRQRLYQQWGAIACDMETMAVATTCRRHKIRFLSVRVISETADEQLPPALEHLLDQKTLAGKLGAASSVLFKRPSSIKDWWKFTEEATRVSDRLAKFLGGVLPQLP